MRTQKPSQLSLAIHEAGHAVARLADPPAPQIDEISIVDQPDGQLGITRTQLMWKSHMADVPLDSGADGILARELWCALARRDVVMLLAGPVAELRWRYRTRYLVAVGGEEQRRLCFADEAPAPNSDLGAARERLLWATDDPLVAFAAGWETATAVVAANWKAIVTLGRTLAERSVLTGDEVEKEWSRLRCRSAG